MAEIKTPPIRGTDENGELTWTFTEDHTLADVARWLMKNPVCADEVRDMLTEMLQEPQRSPLDGL